MKFYWSHLFRRAEYHRGIQAKRRELELRMILARSVREVRKRHRFTQKQVADWMGSAPSTISHLERGKLGVSFDFGIRVLLTLHATDEEVAAAFTMSNHPMVQRIRARSGKPPRANYENGMLSKFTGDSRSLSGIHLRSSDRSGARP